MLGVTFWFALPITAFAIATFSAPTTFNCDRAATATWFASRCETIATDCTIYWIFPTLGTFGGGTSPPSIALFDAPLVAPDLGFKEAPTQTIAWFSRLFIGVDTAEVFHTP